MKRIAFFFIIVIALLVLHTKVYSQWEYENPTTRELLFDVFSLSKDNAWIVGEGGLILKFSGTKWIKVPSPTAENLRSVFLIDNTTGWAVGDNGVILKYDGCKWNLCNISTTENLNSVFFINKTNGWTVGSNGTILHFDGENWKEIFSSTTENLNSVCFVDATHGWIVGSNGKILTLNNGNWINENSGTNKNLYVVKFNTISDGTIVGDNGIILGYNGTNWTDYSFNTTNWRGTYFDPVHNTWYVQASPVHFSTDNVGWAFSYKTPYGSLSGLSVITKNTGYEGWYSFNSVEESPFEIYDIAFTDVNHGYAMSACQILNYKNLEWNHSGDECTGFSSVYMFDTLNGWRVNSDVFRSVYKYDGVNWNKLFDNWSDTLGRFKSIDFSDESHGWIVGEKGSEKSTILRFNGADWVRDECPVYEDLYSVSIVDSTLGWAVGANGTIVKYSNNAWESQNSGVSYSLYSVFSVDSTHSWAVGVDGNILKYNGASWLPQNSGTNFSLYKVFFTDTLHGWAVGDSGTILKYNGIKWTQMDSPTKLNLYSVFFLDNTNGWICGEYSTILRYNYAVNNGFSKNICSGESVQLTAQNSDSTTTYHYIWYPTMETTKTINVNPVISTKYIVTSYDDYGNIAKDSLWIIVDDFSEKPETPVGETTLCQNEQGRVYQIERLSSTDSYLWEISPPEAGTFVGTDTAAILNTNSGFNGMAHITVKGQYSCGTGQSSDELNIVIVICDLVNSTEVGDIFTVQPNPSSGIINLQVNNNQLQNKIEITNSLGQIVYSKEIRNEANEQITIKNTGLYFIKLINENPQTIKVIIE